MIERSMLEKAEEAVRAALPGVRPRTACLLGSGWGSAIGDLVVRERLAYDRIPGLGAAAVEGHSGELLLAEHGGGELLVFAGRRHFYEGGGWTPVAVPVHITRALGANALLVTNAAGGIRPDLEPGDLVVVDDHINLMGGSPLIGPDDGTWGTRFPDMSCPYDRGLRELWVETARDAGEPVKHGVYAAVHGPAYETRAEIQALARLGADLVGMSTVPEVLLAHAAGVRVLGLSLITNTTGARPDGSRLSHDEVVAAAREAEPRLRGLLPAWLMRLHGPTAEGDAT
jgi:purine-nucleoside phosphorylase